MACLDQNGYSLDHINLPPAWRATFCARAVAPLTRLRKVVAWDVFDPVEAHHARGDLLRAHTSAPESREPIHEDKRLRYLIQRDVATDATMEHDRPFGFRACFSGSQNVVFETARPGQDETLCSMGCTRALSILGDRVRARIGFATHCNLITVGRLSLQWCYPREAFGYLASKDRDG